MSDDDIKDINEILIWLTFYVPFVTITIGSISSICNIIIFTSRELRFNSCGFYLLCSTIFDLIYLLLSGITRVLIDNYSLKSLNDSILFCKFRTYFVVVIPFLSTLFLMLASIDRCLSTSTSKKWRDFSQIKVAWIVSIVMLILSLLSTCHILVFYELQKKDNKMNECVPQNEIYRIFVTLFLFLSSPFLVYTIMFICTIITLIRIRTYRCRMGNLNNKIIQRKQRNIDRHLIIILFIQIGLGILLTFFRCGFLIYNLWTRNQIKNIYRINIELIFDKISLLIYYINFAKSFYVNILTSTLFRQVFIQRIIFLCTFKKRRTIYYRSNKNKHQKQIEVSLRLSN